jgi:hypothetical protein
MLMTIHNARLRLRFSRTSVTRSTSSSSQMSSDDPIRHERTRAIKQTQVYCSKRKCMRANLDGARLRALTPSRSRRFQLLSSRHFRLKTFVKRIFSRCRALLSGRDVTRVRHAPVRSLPALHRDHHQLPGDTSEALRRHPRLRLRGETVPHIPPYPPQASCRQAPQLRARQGLPPGGHRIQAPMPRPTETNPLRLRRRPSYPAHPPTVRRGPFLASLGSSPGLQPFRPRRRLAGGGPLLAYRCTPYPLHWCSPSPSVLEGGRTSVVVRSAYIKGQNTNIFY